jgi:hypothetical protein
MEALISVNQNQIKSAIPLIKNYEQQLHSLDLWWGKISLVGKINSQNVSGSILDDMQLTKDKFSALQGKLIQNLLKEHLQRRIAEDHNKSQVAIDILIRNLFERTADVGFLATDDDIRAFLNISTPTANDLSLMQLRLAEYVKKYSVYDEIIILDPQGKVRVHLDQKSSISHSFDPLIDKTLNTSEEYVETFGHSDLQPKLERSLIYSCAIRSSNNQGASILGVLCLCFRFDDEMQGIFTDLQAGDKTSSIMIADKYGQTIASSAPSIFALGAKIPADKSTSLTTFNQHAYLSTATATKGYQGFMGLSWRGQVMTPLKAAFHQNKQSKKATNSAIDLLQSQLFSDDLKEIHKTSILVKDDLNLVVLNGIIAAARQNAVEFMPVLSEIKKIGEDIASIFSSSIDNLQTTVIDSRLDDAKFIAGLAVNLMDRNLYERANDCRWWALTTAFRQILKNAKTSVSDQQKISNILSYINSLYTVYSNLYVYNRKGEIVAVSNPEQQDKVGQVAQKSSGVAEALQINDSQKYSVSAFVPSEQYNKRHTYIYNAAITDLTDKQVLGGIGIVFDSEPQFAAMLNDSLPKDERGKVQANCFAFYCQRDGFIVSATEQAPLKVGQRLPLDAALFTLENGQQQSQMLTLKGQRYAVGIAVSKGYREYKTTGDYKNDILAFVLVKS